MFSEIAKVAKGNTNQKALFTRENHAKTSKALLILRELF